MTFVQASGAKQYFFVSQQIEGGPKEWTYYGHDPFPEVAAASYFADFTAPFPDPGDIIRVYQLENRDDPSTAISAVALYVRDWRKADFMVLGRSE